MYQARSEITDVQERLHSALVAISQTEQKLTQAEQEKLNLMTQAQIELERDLSATESEITEQEVTLAAIAPMLKVIMSPTFSLPAFSLDVSYEIVRRTVAGVEKRSASEMSLLMPGDLVRVRASRTFAGIRGVRTEASTAPADELTTGSMSAEKDGTNSGRTD
jgi:hypothetical protein